ncbi:MAG: hypothetical protein J3K34DRAFT_445794 [Monoraphidium minutum]|nr:MAG: hypothetical protein J3K34DRAFT_445794 [Monoraphidium minutum]
MAALAPSHLGGSALACRTRTVKVQALFGKKSSVAVAEKPATKVPKKGQQTDSVLSAFDFSQTRSQKDADLLWEAKYGERGADGKMSREQYAALRRKIGGTAKDYWKDWVEEEQVKNIKTYYKEGGDAAGTVPFLPVLVGIVLAMLATTVLVVAQTA